MPVVSVDTPNGDKSDEISVTKESVPTNIDVPDGYRAIQVETGINDTDYIEIKSGLTEKDQVRTLDTESSSANASFGDPNAQDMYVVPNGNMGGMSGGRNVRRRSHNARRRRYVRRRWRNAGRKISGGEVKCLHW